MSGYLHGVDITSVSTSTPEHKLGSKFIAANGKEYKYVKYNDGTGNLDLAVGDIVHYIDVTGYAAHTVGADVSDLTGKGIPAGVSPVVVATDASYFWIQTKGIATAAVALETSNDVSPVAAGDGDVLVLGDADKALRRQNTVIDADAERVIECAIASDASAKEIICNFPT